MMKLLFAFLLGFTPAQATLSEVSFRPNGGNRANENSRTSSLTRSPSVKKIEPKALTYCFRDESVDESQYNHVYEDGFQKLLERNKNGIKESIVIRATGFMAKIVDDYNAHVKKITVITEQGSITKTFVDYKNDIIRTCAANERGVIILTLQDADDTTKSAYVNENGEVLESSTHNNRSIANQILENELNSSPASNLRATVTSPEISSPTSANGRAKPSTVDQSANFKKAQPKLDPLEPFRKHDPKAEPKPVIHPSPVNRNSHAPPMSPVNRSSNLPKPEPKSPRIPIPPNTGRSPSKMSLVNVSELYKN